MMEEGALRNDMVAGDLIRQIDAICHPRSVAVVGVPKGMKAGKLFLMALLEQGFAGRIYPVHPEAKEIDGLAAYPSVSAIPGIVDLAIILVSQSQTRAVLRECAAKGVKGAVLFTSGYGETGTAEGRKEEEELTRIARESGMRLIGPNCMGLYVPASGLSFFPGLPREPGPIGIISHSGSLANILCYMAPQRGLRFSTVASLGNECDLTGTDFLRYLEQDEETKVIGVYLESVTQGDAFVRVLRETSLKKPVVLWKVGLTEEGSRAAASHTGALALSGPLWENAVRQTGAVPVTGFEEWVDHLTGCSMLPPFLGDRMAIISGPGGLAVSAADACGQEELSLAELAPETRRTLGEFLPPTGTSFRNPVDVGLTASFDMNLYIQAARTVAADPGVDAVVVCGIGLSPEANRLYADAMIAARHDFGKPFLIVNIPGLDREVPPLFLNAGIPFFESVERAMAVYAGLRRYQAWCRRRGA